MIARVAKRGRRGKRRMGRKGKALRALKALHYPRLDTILMVERVLKKTRGNPTKTQLWRSLPKKTQYQTFKTILEYLLDSGKISISKQGREERIAWASAQAIGGMAGTGGMGGGKHFGARTPF